jgi:hypothetical protein
MNCGSQLLLIGAVFLEQNQSKRARGECKRGGFFFHPSDENMSPETPVEGKSHFAALPLGTATLVLI